MGQALRIDQDTLRKYSAPAPRYTSYPTALKFTPQALTRELKEHLRGMEGRPARAVSLYIHVPFCRQLCWYCGCTTEITRKREVGERYLGNIARELDLLAATLDRARPLAQLHLGGGTPTFLSPDQLARLGQMLRERFDWAAGIEAGIEIDPRTLTPEHVEVLEQVGFNRASLGVQDLDEDVQRAIHRLQPAQMVERCVGWLRQAGIASINVDMIYGLPLQTRETMERTLAGVLALEPSRLAVYGYAHVPWLKPAQKLLERHGLPDQEERLGLISQVIERLTGAGYAYIGLDHFAREDDELALARAEGSLRRNFQGYSTRGELDVWALGISGISQVEDLYVQNHKDLALWEQALDEGVRPFARGLWLTRDDQIRREVIMGLMCQGSLDWGQLSARLGVELREYLADAIAQLAPMEADGLLRCDDAGVELTPMGCVLMRPIAQVFDGYRAGADRYSRAI